MSFSALAATVGRLRPCCSSSSCYSIAHALRVADTGSRDKGQRQSAMMTR